MEDELLVLNYHDAVLYESDVKLLESPTAWLNEACIQFQMTRLEYQELRPATLFFNPSDVSFLMNEEKDNLLQTFRSRFDIPLNGGKLMLPIRREDDDDGTTATTFTCSTGKQHAGENNHWSLLMVVLLKGKRDYYHFDSMTGNNYYAARAVAVKLEEVLVNYNSKSKSVVVAGESDNNVHQQQQIPSPAPRVVKRPTYQNDGYDFPPVVASMLDLFKFHKKNGDETPDRHQQQQASEAKSAVTNQKTPPQQQQQQQHNGSSFAQGVKNMFHQVRNKKKSETTHDDPSQQQSPPAPRVVECQTPQQQHDFDCGIHMLAAAETLATIVPVGQEEGEELMAGLERSLQKRVERLDFCVETRKLMVKDIRQLLAAVDDSSQEASP